MNTTSPMFGSSARSGMAMTGVATSGGTRCASSSKKHQFTFTSMVALLWRKLVSVAPAGGLLGIRARLHARPGSHAGRAFFCAGDAGHALTVRPGCPFNNRSSAPWSPMWVMYASTVG